MRAETSSLLLQPFLVDYTLCPSRYGAQASWPILGCGLSEGGGRRRLRQDLVYPCVRAFFEFADRVVECWVAPGAARSGRGSNQDRPVNKKELWVKSVFFTFGWRRSDEESSHFLKIYRFFHSWFVLSFWARVARFRRFFGTVAVSICALVLCPLLLPVAQPFVQAVFVFDSFCNVICRRFLEMTTSAKLHRDRTGMRSCPTPFLSC